MPILVDMPSRGRQLKFPNDSTEEEIRQALARDFPRSGEDVSWDLKQDYDFVPSIEDFKKFRKYKVEVSEAETIGEKAKLYLGGAWRLAKTGGKAVAALPQMVNPKKYYTTVAEGVAGGSYNMWAMLAQSDDPSGSMFRFKDWISGTGTDASQYDQFLEARKVQRNIIRAERGEESITGIPQEFLVPEVRNALAEVADPSFLVPFGGGVKAAAMAARAAGRVGHAAGTGVRGVGRLGSGIGEIPQFGATLAARAVGVPAEAAARAGGAVGGLTTVAGVGEVGLGLAGAGVALPFGTAAAGFTGAKIIGKGLDAAGEAMQHLSRSMGAGASRTGAFAALAADQSASLGARTLGGIGRRFGADAILPYVGATAGGVALGHVVGGTLGYLSQGEEGLWAGMGGGLVLGAAGGLAGRGVSHLTGGVRRQRIMGDASRSISLMPEAEGAKAQILVERFAKEGDTEAIATLLNTKGWLGEEIPLKFLTEKEAVAKFPDDPLKGVHVEKDANTIYINVERAEGGTVLHEALHGALRTTLGKAYAKPMAEALMKNLNDNQLGAYIWRYVDYKGLKGKARQEAKDAFLADPFRALEEINADYFMDFLQRRENRDLLLTGKRSIDNVIIGNLKNAYDSVLHKMGITDADPFTGHKAVDSLVRELIDARRAITSRNVKQGTMATPLDLSTPAKILTFNKEHGMDHAIIRDEKGNPIGVKDEATLRREMFEMGLTIDEALKDIPGAKEDFLSDKALAAMKPILPPEIFAKLMASRALRDEGKVASIANSPVGVKKGEQTLIFPRGIKESDTLIHSARRSNTPKPKKDGTYSKKQMDRGLGLLLKTIDLSMLRNRADEFFSRPGMLDPWGGDKAAAMADVKRYAENLASDARAPSAEFFGGGRNGAMKRDILNKIWGAVIKAKQSDLVMNENALGRNVRKESYGGGELLIGKPGEGRHTRVTEDIRVERVGKITETGESYRYTEGEVDPVTGKPTGAYAGMQVNLQPDSFTPEKLPGGEAFVHESGYNILQKGRGKFRVYKPDGELLGLRDTMKSAASLAGRNYRKGEARFQPDRAEIDPLGMFSKAEAAAIELKQNKGTGQQMLAMLKKAGVKPEEMQYLGLDKFLKDKKSVTKDEIHDFIVENQITVEETVLGERQYMNKEEYSDYLYSLPEDRVVDLAYEEFGIDKDALRENLDDTIYELAEQHDTDLHSRGIDQETTLTKHSEYVEPGAVEGSYRELLLRLPERKRETVSLDVINKRAIEIARSENIDLLASDDPAVHNLYHDMARAEKVHPSPDYTGGHYGEHPNVLAHVRFNERVSDHGKTLNIEEIQSDWHQEGRKKGYASGETVAEVQKLAHADREKFYSGKGRMSDAEWTALSERVRQWDNREAAAAGAVPDAPFKTSWHELAMKRMIRYAVDNGYDAISWTKGETQFKRYGSSEIAWVKNPKGPGRPSWKVKATEQRGGEAGGIDIEGAARAEGILKEGGSRITSKEQLRDVVENTLMDRERGQWSAENFAKQVDKLTNRVWERMQKEDAGTSLPRKEGMEGFYDKMLPKVKTWKKLGMKVETDSFDTGDFKVFRDSQQGVFGGANPYRLSERHSTDIISRHPTAEAAWAAAGKLGETPTHIVRLSPEAKAKVGEGMARFQPAAREALEGRVVPGTPLDGTVVISPELAARFQPAVMDPGYQSPEGKVAFPMMADRMKVGTYKARSGKEFELRGGPDHPDLVDNLGITAWAVEGGNTATKLQKAINETDGIALVTLQDESAISGNKDFRNIMLDELRHDQATNKKAARSLPRRIKEAAAAIRKTAKKKRLKKQAAAPKGKKVAKNQWEDFRPKTLDELEVTMVDMPFEIRGDVLRKLASIDYKRKTGGIFWRDVMGDTIAYKNEDGYRTGDIVKVIQFDQGESIVNPKDVGTPEHPSYKFAVKGRSVSNIKGRLSAFQVFRDAFETMGKEAPGRGVSPEGKVGASAYRSMMMRSMTDPIFREDVSGKTLDVKAYDEPLEFSAKTGPERAALQRRSEINQELGARFQPAESLPNGTAWRNAAGYNVLQKGKRGKFRAYAPTGKLIGIYDQLKTAQKAAIRLQEKDTAGKARFMPAEVIVEGSQFKGKKSGEEVTFNFIRNTEKAEFFGSRYGQDMEPHGRYIQEQSSRQKDVSPQFETGTITFRSPLLIEWGEGYAQPGNWKNVLSERYGAKGENLSKAILRDGYDGIVTIDRNGAPSEIVDLTTLTNQ